MSPAQPAPAQPIPAQQATTCGPLSFGQMNTALEGALKSVDSIPALRSKFSQAFMTQVMCSKMDSSPSVSTSETRPDAAGPPPSTAEACLGRMATSALAAQCAELAQCSTQLSSVQVKASQLCQSLDKLGCKPRACHQLSALGASRSPTKDALLGCFDLGAAPADDGAAFRSVFNASSSRSSTVRECAAQCAAYPLFAMENSRCSCGDGLLGFAADGETYQVDPSRCGAACNGGTLGPAAAKAGVKLPCGRKAMSAVYRTREVTGLFSSAPVQAAQLVAAEAAAAHSTTSSARSAALLAAAALSAGLIGLVRVARYSLGVAPPVDVGSPFFARTQPQREGHPSASSLM